MEQQIKGKRKQKKHDHCQGRKEERTKVKGHFKRKKDGEQDHGRGSSKKTGHKEKITRKVKIRLRDIDK